MAIQTFTGTAGDRLSKTLGQVTMNVPEEGEVFRIASATNIQDNPAYGVMVNGKVQMLDIEDMLRKDQAVWESVVRGPAAPKQLGNYLVGVRDSGGRETIIPGTDAKLSYQNNKLMVKRSDGVTVDVGEFGGSKNMMWGNIVKAALGIEGNIGYNQDPVSEKNIQQKLESLGLGDLNTEGMNSYYRGDLQKYVGISDQPLDAATFQQALQTGIRGGGEFYKAEQTPEGQAEMQKKYAAGKAKLEGTIAQQELDKKLAQGDSTGAAFLKAQALAGGVGMDATNAPGGAEKWAGEYQQPDWRDTARTVGEAAIGKTVPEGSQSLTDTMGGLFGPATTATGTPNVGNQAAQGSMLPKISPEAMQLVNKALQSNATQNLQQYDWWNNSPVKQEAWDAMNKITGSAEMMAEYVKMTGLQNLQQYDWWSSSPYKQDAWNLISSTSNSAEKFNLGYNQETGETPTGEYDTPTGQPNAPGSLDMNDPLQQAYSIIDSSSYLTDEQKSLFKTVVEGWDPAAEINMDNILTQFRRINSETIDPYFQTLTNQMTDEIERARNFQMRQREMQIEQERFQAGQDIRQMKAGLEKAGMTFTGQGIEELGQASAYAQTGRDTAIPTQQATEGMFYEGNVNQAARLLSSSNQARYLQNMQELGAEAERRLGSGQASLMNIPGAQLTGGVKGELQEQKEGAYASTLSGLAGQERQNIAYRSPIDLNLPT